MYRVQAPGGGEGSSSSWEAGRVCELWALNGNSQDGEDTEELGENDKVSSHLLFTVPKMLASKSSSPPSFPLLTCIVTRKQRKESDP